ncbi:cobyric acid synthase [Pseudodesulfovibrio indicus]|uniref:Cobyric acid synthase n=1 Tax=Pseudodesulfovibrio indicus TaxID=1716143 RepID=A0A126QTB0_9BACT|nr:cobyric acid synthase [Pseudodesulfovibrio indicus]AMK12929.1 threonine-phosphate decarboxylase [Pseudodesulfovibrio indicus]TDT82726.1 L-threonine O-3-phosphate decarboxylase /adenosylcobyric acid synthase (glutamine-hydrolysing) [Pseudodesulfovibrio indicus]
MTKQNLFAGIPDVLDERKFAHGGNVRRMAEQAGCAPEDILDFSANVNPLGPPPWLGQVVGQALQDVDAYPDPDCTALVMAASERYKVWPSQVVAGNGASELLFAIAALKGFRQAVIPAPTYVDYARACRVHRLSVVEPPMTDDFRVDFPSMGTLMATPSLVFLCSPNNPTGTLVPPNDLREVAAMFPQSLFVVDESFAEFLPEDADRLVRDRPANVVTVLSLTKFYAIPGLRLGLAFADPDVVLRIRRNMPAWSVNTLAQKVGVRCLKDDRYAAATREQTRLLRDALAAGLRQVPGIKVHPGTANYLFCRMDRVGQDAGWLRDRLLMEHRIGIRLCGNYTGLDDNWFRVAVRDKDANERLIRAMEAVSGTARGPVVRRARKTPALMIQGTSSNAGKSVLAAAFCRILLQDGYDVAPFKAQNMSLNSYVTDQGGEMGRAQVTQAMACRLNPDVRMNPVLLKPGSDVGSQVIVMGRPVGNMSVRQYVDFKPRAWEAVKAAYDSLANEHDVIVLEGAGSPAEVNLKHHDIVNMAMARYAEARVLLTGDIDRGGVFASIVGTMSLLTPAERSLVEGYVINRFRGDASLLDPAFGQMFERTGKPVLGTVPYIHSLGLPEEDSVSFKDGFRPEGDKFPEDRCVEIVVLDLPRISNFNDIDPLHAEPDVRIRVVADARDVGTPDAVIIPGSKSTVPDMRALKGTGMAAVLRDLAEKRTRIVGICGGFQMLGRTVDDPYGLESETTRVEGFGLLPVQTTLAAEKTLTRTLGVHSASGLPVHGYEIHHGHTEPLSDELRVALRDNAGNPLGYMRPDGRVLGTYLHGVFDADGFRRWFIDQLRMDKGLSPLESIQTAFDMEDALDHLASVVREAVDMGRVYRALGLSGCCAQASLFHRLSGQG